MCLEPTLFDSPMYETANEAVLFVQKYLEENGMCASADTLRGVVPVTDATIGRVTYGVLQSLRARVSGPTAQYVSFALNALERALSAPALRAAG